MDEKELRIGNYIWFNDAPEKEGYSVVGSISQCSDEHGDTYLIFTNDGNAYINEIEGIDLTEEWLLKLGAKMEVLNGGVVGYYDSYSIGGYELSRVYVNMWRFMGFENRTIHHVHQFQNMYFDLTGEELTIK